jgi:hypothetical protein
MDDGWYVRCVCVCNRESERKRKMGILVLLEKGPAVREGVKWIGERAMGEEKEKQVGVEME